MTPNTISLSKNIYFFSTRFWGIFNTIVDIFLIKSELICSTSGSNSSSTSNYLRHLLQLQVTLFLWNSFLLKAKLEKTWSMILSPWTCMLIKGHQPKPSIKNNLPMLIYFRIISLFSKYFNSFYSTMIV